MNQKREPAPALPPAPQRPAPRGPSSPSEDSGRSGRRLIALRCPRPAPRQARLRPSLLPPLPTQVGPEVPPQQGPQPRTPPSGADCSLLGAVRRAAPLASSTTRRSLPSAGKTREATDVAPCPRGGTALGGEAVRRTGWGVPGSPSGCVHRSGHRLPSGEVFTALRGSHPSPRPTGNSLGDGFPHSTHSGPRRPPGAAEGATLERVNDGQARVPAQPDLRALMFAFRLTLVCHEIVLFCPRQAS